MMILVINFAMLSMLFPQGMSMIGASDKVVALMDYLPEINTTGGLKLESPTGQIELENVVFHYPSKKEV